MKNALLAVTILFAAGAAAPAISAPYWPTGTQQSSKSVSQVHGSQQSRDSCFPCGG